MSANYYDLCCRYRGQYVRITDKAGRVHCGRIANIDNRYVYLEQPGRNLGGYGWGFWGYPYFPVALSFIAGVALGGLFFW